LKVKFKTVAQKTAKNFRGLLYFAAPGKCKRSLTVLLLLLLTYTRTPDNSERALWAWWPPAEM